MVKPVPAVGSFHAGSPSHCAAAGVASNVNPSVSAVRFIVPSQRQGKTVWGPGRTVPAEMRSEEHTSELQSHSDLVCRLLLEKKKIKKSEEERKCHRRNSAT